VITLRTTSWKISEAEDIPKLHIYESIRPLKRDIEEHHFIFARNKVEREQNKRLEQEIIERIEGTPTSWVFA
jgi:hypothetical protein